MSIYETSIKKPKKIAEFYKQLSEQKDIEIKQLKLRVKKIDNIINYCQFEIKKEKEKIPCPLESEQWLKGRISAFEEILQVEKSDSNE